MSRSERSMTTHRDASAPTGVERLAELYGNGGKPGKPGKPRKQPEWDRPRKQRRLGRSQPSRNGSSYRQGPRSGPTKLVILLVVLAVGVVSAGVLASRQTWISAVVTGIEDGQILRGDQLDQLELRVRTSGRAAGDVVVMLNGAEIPAPVDDQGVVRASLASATQGTNLVSYRVKSRLPLVKDRKGQLTFTVRFGPQLSVPAAVPPPTTNK